MIESLSIFFTILNSFYHRLQVLQSRGHLGIFFYGWKFVENLRVPSYYGTYVCREKNQNMYYRNLKVTRKQSLRIKISCSARIYLRKQDVTLSLVEARGKCERTRTVRRWSISERRCRRKSKLSERIFHTDWFIKILLSIQYFAPIFITIYFKLAAVVLHCKWCYSNQA